jgi:hypothetical protein
MMATNLVVNNLATGYNISLLNTNFQTIVNFINSYTIQSANNNNVMSQALDMNGYDLLNIGNIGSGPTGILTQQLGDARYVLQSGGVLGSTLNASGYTVTGLAAPVNATDAVRYEDLEAEISTRASEVQNLQNQISGGTPLEASAFSPISWHVQTISNSVAIPANVNAWSFGPTMSLGSGVTVTLGSGSFWTIANGQLET